jgi:hypothetical protein
MHERKAILDAAAAATETHEYEYGSPAVNFDRTAQIWNTILESKLRHKVTAADVGMMLIGFKLARLINSPDHRDTHIDIAGYAALLNEVV